MVLMRWTDNDVVWYGHWQDSNYLLKTHLRVHLIFDAWTGSCVPSSAAKIVYILIKSAFLIVLYLNTKYMKADGWLIAETWTSRHQKFQYLRRILCDPILPAEEKKCVDFSSGLMKTTCGPSYKDNLPFQKTDILEQLRWVIIIMNITFACKLCLYVINSVCLFTRKGLLVLLLKGNWCFLMPNVHRKLIRNILRAQ